MSQESKHRMQNTIAVLQSISGSNVPYARAAESVITLIEGPESISNSAATIALPASVRTLIDQNILPDVDPQSVEELLRIMDQMAQAMLQVSTDGEYLDDQQLIDSISVLRTKFRTFTNNDILMESRYAHKEVDRLVRRATLYVLSDIMNDRGLPVPDFWTEYLV